MNYQDRITVKVGKRGGKLCVRHMRITVYNVLSMLANGKSNEDILDDFPELELEGIRRVAHLPLIVNIKLRDFVSLEATFR